MSWLQADLFGAGPCGPDDVPACLFVVFGATGDLMARKIAPALYHLAHERRMVQKLAVLGVARRPRSDEQFRGEMLAALREHSRTGVDEAFWGTIASRWHYQTVQAKDSDEYRKLAERIGELDAQHGCRCNRVFYLSVGADLVDDIVKGLAAGLARPRAGAGFTRLVVEKPFGHDLPSARRLNTLLGEHFDESQIFRIDHYLGKETVQNLLVFRFANAIFEPLLDRHHVARVEITTAERSGMEGRRGPYYEQAGALRDMVQNHMLQLLTLLAMDVPSSLSAQGIRDEKVKVLRSIPPLTPEQVRRFTARGQYAGAEGVAAYTRESGVAPDSTVETYAAVRLTVDNWRWAGVPFYLRTGKRLAAKSSHVVVVFHPEPVSLFYGNACVIRSPNRLIFRITPDEGISLVVDAKLPGAGMMLRPVKMDFRYESSFESASPEAYEHLLLEVICGDSTLFIRRDEVEAAWRIVDSIRNSWSAGGMPKLEIYPPFSWGPPSADRLFEDPYRGWQTI